MIQNSVIQQVLVNPLYFQVMTKIIMPHGITDLVHCHQHHKHKTLIASYFGSIGIGHLLHTHNLDPIWNTVFISLTFLHFQHDFFFLPMYVRFPLIALILWGFQYFSITPFIFYMCFLHVPNHYRMAWNYLKSHTTQTIFLILATSLVSEKALSIDANIDMSFILSIVIGHILYEEIEIHSIWKKNSFSKLPPLL
jgi:hypothetical protein